MPKDCGGFARKNAMRAAPATQRRRPPVRLPDGIRLGDPEYPDRMVAGESLRAYVGPAGECRNCENADGAMYFWRITDDPKRDHLFITPSGREVLRGARLESHLCPECKSDFRTKWLIEKSGLMGMELEGKKALDMRLHEYHPKTGQKSAWRVGLALQQELPHATSPALFFGPPGTGKTHLLVCLTNAARVIGVWAHYTTSEAILRRLKATFDGQGNADAIRVEYEGVDVLCVDELHAVKWSDWAGEQLFGIIEGRHASGRPTWFASNAAPGELKALSPVLGPILSRISTGYSVRLDAEDQRPRETVELPEWVHE